MRRLYLLRHGTAEAEATDDSTRELVEKGRVQSRRVAELLLRMGVKPDAVVSSPYTRARQTATELLSGMGMPVELQIDERLVPHASVKLACAAITEVSEALTADATVCAVGHEPLLSSVAAAIIGGAGTAIDLRKGSLVEISIFPSDGELRGELRGALLGLVRPRHLRDSEG